MITTAGEASGSQPPTKKSRTNTPWTPAEEMKLKTLRDAGSSWSDIAKVREVLPRVQKVRLLRQPSQDFPNRTEGSVKKHWYKV